MTDWDQVKTVESHSFTCGFCGNVVASARGYRTQGYSKYIRICPQCDNPTFFEAGMQIPAIAPGNEVRHLPEDIEQLYKETRNCVSAQAYTSSVLACRKLLMNIAVSQGAEEGESFFKYVKYLADKGYIPPNGYGWVDHIRKIGNEATHEIAVMRQEDAVELITFIEMLLKFIYEFPNRLPTEKNP
jgi:hypothetical protein